MRFTLGLLVLAGCSDMKGGNEDQNVAATEGAPDPAPEAPGAYDGWEMEESDDAMGGDGFLMADLERKDAKKNPSGEGSRVKRGAAPGKDESPGPATRSWFPETFLWQPLVVTDATGHAELPVTVPDTLTTWRVLGLAASRDGAQAGDVHSFSSRLPVYVDPRVPSFLRAGDRLEAPVRVVNTTNEGLIAQLAVSAMGLRGSAMGRVLVPAGGSGLEIVTLVAQAPGLASLSARLGDADAVVKTLDVLPVGRPVRESRSGLLGTEDAVELMTPVGAEHARVRLTLYPGPLGVLRDQLAWDGHGDTVQGQAYAFALGADGGAVLSALGAPPDSDQTDQLRALRLRAQQGLVRHANATGDPATLALILQATDRMPDDAVAERLASRMRSQLIAGQLGDGSWNVPSGSTVQRLIVTTAMICTALDDPGARVRAGAVFERHADLLLDPTRGDAYTAAWVLRSGAGTEELRAQLTEVVESAVRRDAKGVATVRMPTGVQRPDGSAVRAVDALALASLALEDADLAAATVGSYQPRSGFGDGISALAALDALSALGEQQRPDSLDVVLLMDGEEVARHQLRGSAMLETAVLEAPAPLSGSHRYEVVSEGAWPGLSWHLDLDSWVSWAGYEGVGGLEVEVDHRGGTLGEAAEVHLVVSAPRTEAVVLHHAPPVGFVIDRDSVVGAEVVRIDDAGIELRIPAGHSGLVEVQYAATPTFRGDFSTGPARASLARDPSLFSAAAPQRWTVR